MEIYIVSLILRYNLDNKWETEFKVEKSDKKYNLEKNIYKPTVAYWVMKSIPTYIEVSETQYGGIYKAVIGLEKEPTQEELNELKIQMKYKILEYLSNRKDEYLRNYNDKIECLNEIKY